MKSQQVAAATSLCGLCMVLLSFFWPTAGTATASYTDEDAEQFQKAVARVHGNMDLEARAQGKANMHGREPVDPEELLAHRKDKELLEELQEKKESARGRTHLLSGLLKWGGGGLVAIGAAMLLMGRQQSS